MNNLEKIQNILNSNGIINSYEQEYGIVTDCLELAKQGKLAYFEYCKDSGQERSNFAKYYKFYEKTNIELNKKSVFIFRLPFFETNFSVKLIDSEIKYSYRGIKISTSKNENKETVKEKTNEIVKNIFAVYVAFIRCWITKSDIDYMTTFKIIEHYSNNDGLITIPSFLSNEFADSLNPKLIKNNTPNKSSINVNLICNKFLPKITQLHNEYSKITCPHCHCENITNKKILTCNYCRKVSLNNE